jgi:crossover junction endodeoxyribonuclease RuvC
LFSFISGKNKCLHKPPKIILGIDPGTLFMGYGIIEINGPVILLKEMNVLKLSGKQNNYDRLRLIHNKVASLVSIFSPDELAIEAPFFGKNVQSMLKLGRAQGVAIAAALTTGIPVTEYSPKKIKQSITGNGNADKEQVWRMLKQIINLVEKPSSYDATDALAVAVCHHFQSKVPVSISGKAAKGWGDFIKKNPERIHNSG